MGLFVCHDPLRLGIMILKARQKGVSHTIDLESIVQVKISKSPYCLLIYELSNDIQWALIGIEIILKKYFAETWSYHILNVKRVLIDNSQNIMFNIENLIL